MLKQETCEMVAMESTGSYWKPLYNVLAIEDMEAMVVNAAHMKTLPGRKTDVKDAEWIADLLRHGMLKASFILDKAQREYRELTCYRNSRVEERARELNRLQKMLEGANIKLSNSLSDINGKSAKALIQLAITHEDITEEQIANARYHNLKATVTELKESLTGVISPLQRELFAEVLRIIEEQTRQIERIEAMIRKYTTDVYDTAAKALDVLPGVGRISAEQIIAEIGIDMGRFPTAHHLCAWQVLLPAVTKAPENVKAERPAKAKRP